ncbi:MAG: aminodeoxychorismate/anthranilate synthase component II [Alphaproteobacteria bacterium]|nr:aminodeoxychorismate/anthranilate synthase component II [Alphaproteobacteria bacterium]MBP7760088.1 aminodeoxychorismate/anthranilate synthase component II [Alphaproteobacteria bacterium]MBP7762884.1 aminodeoxychorismate/anthranilate synthase component II [Alphaproteobacteria bacterium]MBP7905065.1 aminodeoxychorismate/anthranilate synthase component II [Alphaproteobacteria bacterium]
MILVIDNYDSFVYNLARYVERLGGSYEVRRNDCVTLEEVEAMRPDTIILSPGPCAPEQAGICVEAVKKFAATIPILGVCLGHQAIGEAFGGKTIRAEKPVHGKATQIEHDGTGLFRDQPSPMKIGRYHSLVTQLPENTPLIVTARAPNGEIMAMRHREYPTFGVQFHPESVLTPTGIDLLYNFVIIADEWNRSRKINAPQALAG